MKLVIEIIPHSNDELVIHRVIEKFPATVGRGFNNDIILTDPHVSPQHLRIDYSSDRWIVSDLDSANGFRVNRVERRGHDGLPVISGDIISLGQTELRVYAPHHPVADAVQMQKSHPVFSWLSRPLNIWACFLLAVAVIEGWSFLEIWTEEPGMVLAAAAAGTAGVVVLWATLWSVGGRLVNHRSHFKKHAAIMSIYLTVGAVAWYIEAYTNFLTNENWLSALTSYGINFILLAFLLYGSLALASRMMQRRRLLSSVFFSAGVMGGIFAMTLISAKNFNQQPLYPSTLEPYLSRLAPADTVDEFMTSSEKIFSSKEFAKNAVPKLH